MLTWPLRTSPLSLRRADFSAICVAIGSSGQDIFILLAKRTASQGKEAGVGGLALTGPGLGVPRVPIGATGSGPRWLQGPAPGLRGVFRRQLARATLPVSRGKVLEPAAPTVAAPDWCPSQAQGRRCGMDSCWYLPGCQPWTSS